MHYIKHNPDVHLKLASSIGGSTNTTAVYLEKPQQSPLVDTRNSTKKYDPTRSEYVKQEPMG